MTAWVCKQCDPGCYLQSDEVEVRTPEQCPWKGSDTEAIWKEAEE